MRKLCSKVNQSEEGKKAFRLIIHGRVQGVGFRYSAVREAQRHGLTGWVRNEADGTVGVYCAGPEDRLNRFISWCRRGPTMAYVSDVEIQELPYKGRYSKFSVAY